jgi:DNA ligase (NAD+)
LRGITVQIGRLGTLTPVAELEPVYLGGVVVKRATLHNVEEITRLGLNIGDIVIVQRAADVIPQVAGLAHKESSGVWQMPMTCPSCQQLVRKVAGQVAVRCTNANCHDQVIAWLEHAVKKQCLDIDGCGEKAIKALVEHNVATLSGLFAIQDVSFLGDAASKRFIAGRNKAKSAPLWRKLHALGLDGLGITTCKELANRWNSVADMLEQIDEVEQFLGPVAFANFQAYFGDINNINELEKLIKLGVTFSEEKKTGVLTGKTFCITGTLSSGQREDVIAKIESLGGVSKSSVSKTVQYLVMGDGAGQTKSAAAKRLGVKVITEDELYAMMGLPLEPAILKDIEM